MTTTADLLVEIGTEELPPKSLGGLMHAFAENLAGQLSESRLRFEAVRPYASPRRLAVIVTALAGGQDDREVEAKGPPVSVAFDKEGNPTPAAEAFARKCGVGVERLEQSASEKGEWLSFRSVEKGASTAGLLPGLVAAALDALPIPRRMRWGDSDAEFVRPVHWVVMLHGGDVIPGQVLGISSGAETRGHRFLAPGPFTVTAPDSYLSLLENPGYVIADFAARRRRVVQGVADAAAEAGGTAVGEEALYDEVTALVEWPVAMTGRFDDEFLALPREVIVATLTSHQRYFPVCGNDGELLPAFVTVANIVSTDPAQVRDGNERVIRPRLADAAFFWEADQRQPLGERQAALENVVYQQGLGSLLDKSGRVAALAGQIAAATGADPALAGRAALLAKCDLVTGMVGEFPELQGTMGRYYAHASGEPRDVAEAIGEQYLPRFAGDELPLSATGRCLAVADKLDTLCGIFALGRKPSGNRDPFGLRRSALGIVRIIVENRLDLSLTALVASALQSQPVDAAAGTGGEIYDFIIERMRSNYLERDSITPEIFEAVRERSPESLLDFDQRIDAVAAFVGLDSAASLAAASKRIANILRQAGYPDSGSVDTALLTEGAERSLYDALQATRADVAPLLGKRAYREVLARLAELREPVDTFFDDVMVMTDDERLKANRLALLAELRRQFLDVADISRLSIGKG